MRRCCGCVTYFSKRKKRYLISRKYEPTDRSLVRPKRELGWIIVCLFGKLIDSFHILLDGETPALSSSRPDTQFVRCCSRARLFHIFFSSYPSLLSLFPDQQTVFATLFFPGVQNALHHPTAVPTADWGEGLSSILPLEVRCTEMKPSHLQPNSTRPPSPYGRATDFLFRFRY